MNQDGIKLVIDQLDRVELQYLCDTDTVQTAINMLETLGNKVAEQAAVIEKLRASILSYHHYLMKNSEYKNSVGYKINEALLVIPTDSKQILADWMREQLGEPVAWACWADDDNFITQDRASLLRIEPVQYENKYPLYKLPDILK